MEQPLQSRSTAELHAQSRPDYAANMPKFTMHTNKFLPMSLGLWERQESGQIVITRTVHAPYYSFVWGLLKHDQETVQMDEMFWCSARSRLPLFTWDPDSHQLSNGWMYASHPLEMPFFSYDHNVFSPCDAGGGSKFLLEWWQLKAGCCWPNNPSSSFLTGQGKLCWWYCLKHSKVTW